MAKRILLADDSAFMRTMLKRAISNAGYEISAEVQSGEEAVRKYRELKPDLVTMDIVMLGDGGLKAVKDIIAQDKAAKVLMVSSMGQQALVVDAINAGAKGFIVKPFEPEQLIAEVKRIIG